MKESLEVRPSPIHGSGLFATRPIAAGTLIGHYRGRPARHEGRYTIWSADGNQAEDVICRFRYVNHSENPNVAYQHDRAVIALEDIARDEELTLDYSGG